MEDNEANLYKAKNLYNDEWIMCIPCGEWSDDIFGTFVVVYSNNNADSELVKVKTSTLCRYTGFEASDLTRIFEGDILEQEGREAVVIADENNFAVKYLEDNPNNITYSLNYYLYGENPISKTLVVGNIHDHET